MMTVPAPESSTQSHGSPSRGTAPLLVQILHAWGMLLQHEPHVRTCQCPMPKGVRRHNDWRGVVDMKLVPDFCACFGGQAPRAVLLAVKPYLVRSSCSLSTSCRWPSATPPLFLPGGRRIYWMTKSSLRRVRSTVEVGWSKPGQEHLRVVEPQRADNVVLCMSVAVAVNAGHTGRRETVDEVEDLSSSGGNPVPTG